MKTTMAIVAAAIIGLLTLTACGKERVTTFEECAAAGNPVMESSPRQCAVNGQTFTEELQAPGEVPAIGGQRDEHGCLGPAGYSWNADIGACTRSWELDENQTKAAKIALESSEPSLSTTVVEVNAMHCPGCYAVRLEQGPERAQVMIRLSEWKVLGLGEPMPAACTKEYMPVCGKIQVECIKAPCEPVSTTFGNRCEAQAAGALDIQEGACQDESVNPEGACLSFDGAWDPTYKECAGMSQEQCETLGGTFDECASACRHDSDAQVCTMQCVVVCSFK